MVSEDDYCSMKLKVPEIKRLLEGEHYIRCVTYGEHLLLRYHEQIHPIHLIYIHFYLAMAHDAMAREPTQARRYFELNRAEKHYLLAIASLNSQISDAVPPPYYPRPPPSPTLSEDDYGNTSRRTSNASQQSFASSATSLSEEDHETALTKPFHQHTTSLTPPSQKLPDAPIVSQTALSDQEWVFLADLSCFRGVVRDHLRQVVELKQAMLPPVVPPSPTPTHSRSHSSISFIPNTAVTHSRTQSQPYAHTRSHSSVTFIPSTTAAQSPVQSHTHTHSRSNSIISCFPTTTVAPPRTPSRPLTHSRSHSSISFLPTTTTTAHSRTFSTPVLPTNNGMGRFAGRRAIPSRPRFDPTSIQKLCSESLFELRR
ncbi:hypothetical protein DM02DRAFT_666206 [Periconia macrospinosa]|uniref:Uncharacterized protein n=1 Tax=Periconia macrospinosa TaxID=97972 RepID=A0A2V1ECJ4_9PLEO|nr:hypothetical protein DM02DRAFT_666206 [Periconia macrospinosa]